MVRPCETEPKITPWFAAEVPAAASATLVQADNIEPTLPEHGARRRTETRQ